MADSSGNSRLQTVILHSVYDSWEVQIHVLPTTGVQAQVPWVSGQGCAARRTAKLLPNPFLPCEALEQHVLPAALWYLSVLSEICIYQALYI